MAAAGGKLALVPDVDIEPTGKFKYILIKVYNKENTQEDEFKYIVRGYSRCEYHGDIYDEVEPVITGRGSHHLECECVGGGRIERNPQDKTIKVYGYSQGYGKADHEKSKEILKKKFPDYTVTWSNDGY